MKSPISVETSVSGRRQFSLEKANNVSAPTPKRAHSRMVARTGSIPAR